jgi:RNA polymerase sigma factor (sigma-70 family)
MYQRKVSGIARMAQVGDEEILGWIKEGGESENEAARWMYRLYFPMVRQHIIHNKGNEEDSFDLFQESVLDFLHHVKQDRLQSPKVKPYLMGIVRNKWLNQLRRKGYGDQYISEMKQTLGDDQEAAPDVPDPLRLEAEKEIAVGHLFSKLGAKCVEILRLRFWDGFKMQKIAERMAYKSSQIAKNKHFRCLEELRALLRDDDQLRNHLRGLL